ncbi:hypothetical protein EMIT0P294_20649 [Pseudomonas sp. IT-P294]
MALVAITSVQFTTPMRTFWHEAGSAAMTLALRKAVPLSARTQLLISRFISGFLGSSLLWVRSSLCAGDAKLRSLRPAKAHCGDQLLHCGDLCS